MFITGLIICAAAVLIYMTVRNGAMYPAQKIGEYWSEESDLFVKEWTNDGSGAAAGKAGVKVSDTQAGAGDKDPQTVSGNSSKGTDNKDNEDDKDNEKNSAEDKAESTSSDINAGVTEFITYTPQQTDSKYYSDPGKIALTTTYDYVTVTDDSYFDDAAFIGDSRMLGLNDYCGWKGADFYCDNGFCTYDWQNGKTVTFQRTHKKVKIEDALSQKNYTKIYLMIGMNDCGYGNTADFKQRLSEMISMFEEKRPDAVIYLMANLHVSREKAQDSPIFNNTDINDKNVAIGECADGIHTFYLDYNGLFTDESGFLKQDMTFDGAHLYARCYQPWLDFIKSHVVRK